MTHELNTKKGKLLLVEVPKDSNDFSIIHNKTRLAWFTPSYHRMDLPKNLIKNDYKILGKFNKLQDKDIEEFIEQDYINNYKDIFISLCQAQNIINIDDMLLIQIF